MGKERRTWVTELVKRARAVGWPVSQTSNGHYRVTSEVTGEMTTMPSTPGGGRGQANAEAWFRRNGLQRAEAALTKRLEHERLKAIERDRQRVEDIVIPTAAPSPEDTTPQPQEEKMDHVKRGKTRVDEVIAVLADAAGKPVHVDTMAATLGMTREQVQKAIISQRSRHGSPIEIVVKGRSYRWIGDQTAVRDESDDEKVEPEAPGESETAIGDEMVFELVGRTRSRLIIKDDRGVLYEARELD